MKARGLANEKAGIPLPIRIATPAANGANFDGHADGRVSPANSSVSVSFFPNGAGTTPEIPGNVTVVDTKWEATFDLNGVQATSIGFLSATNNDVAGAESHLSGLVWTPPNSVTRGTKAAAAKAKRADPPTIKLTHPIFAEHNAFPEEPQAFTIRGKATAGAFDIRLSVVRVDESTGFQYPILGIVTPPIRIGSTHWIASVVSSETGANAFSILAYLTDKDGNFVSLDTSGNITIKKLRLT